MKRSLEQAPLRLALREVAEHLEARRRFVARQALRALMTRLAPDAGDPGDRVLLEVVFASALASLLSDTGRGDGVDAPVDLDRVEADFEVPDAELDELLERRAPWLQIAAGISRAAIGRAWARERKREREFEHDCEPTDDRDELALIALGPRRGARLVDLVERLADGRLGVAMPARLHLIAVEPDALDLAELVERVGACAAALGIAERVVVRPVCARPDGLQPHDWRHAHTLCGGAVPVVHASAALSEVPPEARAALFARLCAIEPSALVVEAVDHAHLDGGLVHRFDWCWTHYAARVEALEQAGLDTRDRRAILICHFGRAIEALLTDGLAGSPRGASARARHLDDRATTWRDLAHEAGFALAEPPTGDVLARAGCRAAPSADGIVRVVRGGLSLAAVVVVDGPEPSQEEISAPVPAPGSSLVMRLDAVPRPVDVHTYLAALLTAARADHIVHDAERAFVERQARLLHVDEGTLAVLPPVDVLLDESGDPQSRPAIEPRTARAIVRDLVFLARVDGEYHAHERDLIRRLAGRLGFDEAWLARVERLATVPDLIADTPSWFQEYWFLAHKS